MHSSTSILAGLAIAFLFAFAFGASNTQPGSQPSGSPKASAPDPDRAAITAVLDALHESASKADGTRYFGLFTPDAVFLGTDATERWTLEQFKAYANPLFAKGKGWIYTARDRHIFLNGAAGNTAWFDERLDNAKLGECRGTGVLVKSDHGWKIAQYNLTVPVPNELMAKVVELIKAPADSKAAVPASPAK